MKYVLVTLEKHELPLNPRIQGIFHTFHARCWLDTQPMLLDPRGSSLEHIEILCSFQLGL